MKFRINLTPSAEEDLRYFGLYEQKTIVAGIKSYLREDADIESHRLVLEDTGLRPALDRVEWSHERGDRRRPVFDG